MLEYLSQLPEEIRLGIARAIALIRQILADGATQTEAIEYLWGCKKGGSKAYRSALAKFQSLTNPV